MKTKTILEAILFAALMSSGPGAGSAALPVQDEHSTSAVGLEFPGDTAAVLMDGAELKGASAQLLAQTDTSAAVSELLSAEPSAAGASEELSAEAAAAAAAEEQEGLAALDAAGIAGGGEVQNAPADADTESGVHAEGLQEAVKAVSTESAADAGEGIPVDNDPANDAETTGELATILAQPGGSAPEAQGEGEVEQAAPESVATALDAAELSGGTSAATQTRQDGPGAVEMSESATAISAEAEIAPGADAVAVPEVPELATEGDQADLTASPLTEPEMRPDVILEPDVLTDAAADAETGMEPGPVKAPRPEEVPDNVADMSAAPPLPPEFVPESLPPPGPPAAVEGGTELDAVAHEAQLQGEIPIPPAPEGTEAQHEGTFETFGEEPREPFEEPAPAEATDGPSGPPGSAVPFGPEPPSFSEDRALPETENIMPPLQLLPESAAPQLAPLPQDAGDAGEPAAAPEGPLAGENSGPEGTPADAASSWEFREFSACTFEGLDDPNEIEVFRDCMESEPDDTALLRFAVEAANNEYCGIAVRIFSSKGRSVGGKFALVYAAYWDPLHEEKSPCFMKDFHTAYYWYQKVLDKDPENKQALQALENFPK